VVELEEQHGERKKLTIVTGAPGAGKTTTISEILKIRTEFMVFDIDWLAESAGKLAEKDIYTDSTTWVAYGGLWFEFLHSIYKNSKRAIFFTPNTPSDIEGQGTLKWCDEIGWLLLDCTDNIRMSRLNSREDWCNERKAEALRDAEELRGLELPAIDTGSVLPRDVAQNVITFAQQFANES
jgi:adenylate kinase family enzyme